MPFKLFVAAAAGAVATHASAIDVAIVSASSSSPTSSWYTTMQDLLLGTTLFDTVDVLPLASGTGTPTLDQLQMYDAVIVWTNSTPDDNEALGDVLADYVDAGGGVVVAVFANSTTTAGRDIGGRWRDNPDYEVIVPRSGNTTGRALLGDFDPAHPIMNDVGSFDGGSSSFRPTVTDLHPGATAIAHWDDGRVLVAVGANPKRVDLGFYPHPSTISSSFWDITTDGDKIMGNALVFVASGSVCYADCDRSGSLDFFDFLCFQNEFATGAPYADCDGSGALDFFDFLCFQNEFAAGCP
ncbi:MAG: PEP-CTERM sorting domain-containing protein [Phycisphaerales bacterium JB039]